MSPLTLLQRASPPLSFPIPPATLAGYLVLGETLTGPELAGGAITLGAVGLVSSNVSGPKKEARKKKKAPATEAAQKA